MFILNVAIAYDDFQSAVSINLVAYKEQKIRDYH
jgi:hypothetical protein